MTATIASLALVGCEGPESESREKPESPQKIAMDAYGPFEGDLSADAAFDELGTVLEHLANRNDELTALKGFCSVDVPSVRANIVMLTTLITEYGGGVHVSRERFKYWREAIRQVFEDEEKWAFPVWADVEKQAWLDACNADLASLKAVVQENWE